ncbi:MAG: glycosyltransferase family 87 protein [Acidimicrobiia bacterium]
MIDRLRAAVASVPSWLRATLAIGGFIAIGSWLTITTWHGISSSRGDVGLHTDFRDAIYYPVVALRDHVNPYDADTYFRRYPVGQEFPLYTPVHLLLHLPLLAFSLSTARAVDLGWNLLLVLGLAATALRLAGHRLALTSVFGLGALVLLSDPGKFDLRTGQPTLIIVISAYLAWQARAPDRGAERTTPATATVPIYVGVIALAIVWSKPTFAIPLTVLLLVRDQRRVALLGTALGAALSAVVLPWLVDAAGGVSELVQSWQDSARITSQSVQSRLGSGLRIDAANTFVRVTQLHPSELVGSIAGLVLLAVGAWTLWRLHRADPGGDREDLTLTLGCLLILTCLYHVPYDELLLVAPMLLLARRARVHGTAWPRRARVAVFVLLLIPLVDPLGWSPINAVLGKSGFEWMLGSTMLSLDLVAALGLCLWTGFRQIRARGMVAPVSA